MRISDWSSDVCSSDLSWIGLCGRLVAEIPPTIDQLDHFGLAIERVRIDCAFVLAEKPDDRGDVRRDRRIEAAEIGEREMRSEVSRVGKECVGTCRSRGAPINKTKIRHSSKQKINRLKQLTTRR